MSQVKTVKYGERESEVETLKYITSDRDDLEEIVFIMAYTDVMR